MFQRREMRLQCRLDCPQWLFRQGEQGGRIDGRREMRCSRGPCVVLLRCRQVGLGHIWRFFEQRV